MIIRGCVVRGQLVLQIPGRAVAGKNVNRAGVDDEEVVIIGGANRQNAVVEGERETERVAWPRLAGAQPGLLRPGSAAARIDIHGAFVKVVLPGANRADGKRLAVDGH